MLLVVVVIFPILFGFAIAFTNYNLYHTPPAKLVDWVGLKNFINIFTLSIWRSTFLDVLQWTVVWTLLATTLQCTVGVLLAILVNQKDLRFKPLIRTIFILPWAVPGFVTILVFAGMFNDSFGVINNAILSFFGISPKAWLTDPFWTKTALIMMQTWLGLPLVLAMTTGVLQAIPDDLNEAATLFRRKYYQNGAHAGYILYVTDAAQSGTDVEALRDAMRSSKGLGNLKNLFFNAPHGKPDGIKIVPLSEVATKDDFFNIKKVSAADLLDAHRIPFQLMGGKPENVGSLGDIEKVAKVFVRNALIPLQDRMREVNAWAGQEVIRFKRYTLDTESD